MKFLLLKRSYLVKESQSKFSLLSFLEGSSHGAWGPSTWLYPIMTVKNPKLVTHILDLKETREKEQKHKKNLLC